MRKIHGAPHVETTRSGQVDVPTHKTARQLTLLGLEVSEAANLTAYLCGIAAGDRSWKLAEINRLLFLRDLVRRGKFGRTDGSRRETARPAELG
jgi:hypothetical protein